MQGLNLFEIFRIAIPQGKTSASKVIVNGVQTQAPGLYRLMHPVVREQVFDRQQNSPLLAQAATHA